MKAEPLRIGAVKLFVGDLPGVVAAAGFAAVYEMAFATGEVVGASLIARSGSETREVADGGAKRSARRGAGRGGNRGWEEAGDGVAHPDDELAAALLRDAEFAGFGDLRDDAIAELTSFVLDVGKVDAARR